MLDAIRKAAIMAVDTEGTGLNLWGGDMMIGISVYTAPEEHSFYIPFRHGQGSLGNFDDLRGTSKAKNVYKHAMQDTLYRSLPYAAEVQAENMPIEWMEELKAVWTIPGLHIYHNAQYDLTSLSREGFPTPERVHDTMINAHVIFQGWNDVTFQMPDGSLERGGKGLKWQAKYWSIPGAELGEGTLDVAMTRLQGLIDEAHATAQSHDADMRCKITDSARLDTKKHMWMLKPSEVNIYAELDTIMTYKLWRRTLTEIMRWNNTTIHNTIQDTQFKLAWRLHMTGFRVDVDAAKEMMAYAASELKDIEAEAVRLNNGEPINLSSNPQMVAYMRSLGHTEVTSAAEEALAPYADEVPMVNLSLRYSSIKKYANTYLKKWLVAAEWDNGVIHPEFNVTGAETGRWSSSSKYVNNLQNIPRNSSGKVNPKAVLLPLDDDYVLIEVDYSSLESGMGAWISETLLPGDPQMRVTNLILTDADMHSYTRDAAGIPSILLHGKEVTDDNVWEFVKSSGFDLDEVQSKTEKNYHGSVVEWFMKEVARARAKTVNFAAQYGAGIRGLRKPLKVSDAQVQAILDGWRAAYPALRYASKHLQDEALDYRLIDPNDPSKGMGCYVRYPELGFGQFTRRYDMYPLWTKTKEGGRYSPRNKAAWKAANSITQGTAGLVMTNAGTRIANEFPEDVLCMHASVHDSLILSLHKTQLHHIHRIVELMSDYDVYPPLKVGIEASLPGQAWGHKRTVRDVEKWIASEGTVFE
jgi:DNA polymerase I-like protein with 3'-5' exonuclease and polymerase domains